MRLLTVSIGLVSLLAGCQAAPVAAVAPPASAGAPVPILAAHGTASALISTDTSWLRLAKAPSLIQDAAVPLLPAGTSNLITDSLPRPKEEQADDDAERPASR
jgi:hypothetical protein